MDIVYTDYADDTLQERALDKKLIEDALMHPNEIVEGRNNRKIAHKIIGSKLLRIIYEPHAKTYIVITAYYARPERYMNNENNL